MGKIVVLPVGCQSRASYLSQEPLPANYMSDFTVMGLMVNQYAHALNLLGAHGYSFEKKQFGTDVEIAKPAHIKNLLKLFKDEGIASEYADIADTIYQA